MVLWQILLLLKFLYLRVKIEKCKNKNLIKSASSLHAFTNHFFLLQTLLKKCSNILSNVKCTLFPCNAALWRLRRKRKEGESSWIKEGSRESPTHPPRMLSYHRGLFHSPNFSRNSKKALRKIEVILWAVKSSWVFTLETLFYFHLKLFLAWTCLNSTQQYSASREPNTWSLKLGQQPHESFCPFFCTASPFSSLVFPSFQVSPSTNTQRTPPSSQGSHQEVWRKHGSYAVSLLHLFPTSHHDNYGVYNFESQSTWSRKNKWIKWA